MNALLLALLRPLIEAAIAAFGQVLIDLFKTWQAHSDAVAVGRGEAELTAARRSHEVAESMAEVPEPSTAEVLSRLREGTQ